MAGWFDKLKSLFNIEPNSPLISINYINNAFNKKSIPKDSLAYLDTKENKLYINFDQTSQEQKTSLNQIINEYMEEGNRLLQTDTEELLRNLYDFSKNKEDKQIVEFFKPVISPNDVEALEASLYLRAAFKQGRDVSKLKRDIRETFGSRGNTVSNLCTAGYFEHFLMQLYNADKENFGKFQNSLKIRH